jgi:serine/threonine protein kinase/Flp pilus assembly protein TadD
MIGPPLVPPGTRSGGGRSSLVERAAAEMHERWRAGERPLTEEYLGHYPGLQGRPEAALELLYEELCLRREHGVPTRAEDLLGRFPQWADAVRVLLECHDLLEGRALPAEWPAVGEQLGEFTLLAELGRGNQGRVFLASQPALAGRLVVLKVAPAAGQEHLSLARLQHTNIAPLYAVFTDLPRRVRVLCLPWFGGASLDRLLRLVADLPAAQRRARDLSDALARAQDGLPAEAVSAGRAPPWSGDDAWTRAICSIGIHLAEALDHAHARGIVHLDLKPSNVLLTSDGTPMLLDFHLARAPITAGSPAPPWLGGTPEYMAPEQRLALEAVRRGEPIAVAVDGRADIYGLGAVLYEALGGALSLPERRPGDVLRRENRSVTPGLADIVARCLSPDPARRYATAREVARDLRCHLADLPLLGVRNRSPGERWAKWRRRRPYAFPLLVGLLALAVAVGTALQYSQRQAEQARQALQEGRAHLAAGRYGEAAGSLGRAVALADALPLPPAFAGESRRLLGEAERAQAVGRLHDFVEAMREAHAGEPPTREAAGALEGPCQLFWDNRARIRASLIEQADEELARQARLDLLDLAIFHAGLLARRERPAGRREALEVLAQAEALYGPSGALCREREAHALALGLGDLARQARRQADTLPPQTAWEHLALGRRLLAEGRPAEALVHFDRAFDLQPASLWANAGKGRCAYQLGRALDALAAFHACVALAPHSAWCRYNRGLAHAALGRDDEALRDYDRALALDAKLAPARLNRAMLHHHHGRHDEALADLRQALADGASAIAVLYNRALVERARGDHAAALTSLREALRRDPGHRDARALLDLLLSEPDPPRKK